MRARAPSFGDFRCAHCHNLVLSARLLSGVNHRNHCPYCLWSCHLDLFAPGDRLSACKAPMEPIGLSLKKVRNKYRPEGRGELMLVHQCIECAALSINRIAADDDRDAVTEVFNRSFWLEYPVRARCETQAIAMLGSEDAETVHLQLYGLRAGIPALEWR
jgi:hypothetical protein